MRIDGVLYEEGGSGLTLVAGNGARRGNGGYAVDTAAGRFSASGAVGLAGHVENFFLATYLRDFNRIVPLTSESSVTEGMLEVLSPAVLSSGLSAASPIKQPESRRQAKLAVFWGVVAMGSRILGANEESTTRYLGLMRTALRECFDCNDKEVGPWGGWGDWCVMRAEGDRAHAADAAYLVLRGRRRKRGRAGGGEGVLLSCMAVVG